MLHICWTIIHYRTPRQCCTALLEDWVTTDNGVKPKTWKKLIEVLSEVEDVKPVINEIKEGLMSEGVVLYGGYVIVCTNVSVHVSKFTIVSYEAKKTHYTPH